MALEIIKEEILRRNAFCIKVRPCPRPVGFWERKQGAVTDHSHRRAGRGEGVPQPLVAGVGPGGRGRQLGSVRLFPFEVRNVGVQAGDLSTQQLKPERERPLAPWPPHLCHRPRWLWSNDSGCRKSRSFPAPRCHQHRRSRQADVSQPALRRTRQPPRFQISAGRKTGFG